MGVPGGTTGLIFTPVAHQIKYHKAEAVAGQYNFLVCVMTTKSSLILYQIIKLVYAFLHMPNINNVCYLSVSCIRFL